MCKYTYTLYRKGDPECECRYFTQRPQYCDRALLPTTTTTTTTKKSSSPSFFSSSSKTKNRPPASPASSTTGQRRRHPPESWTPLLSISHSRLDPCDVVMEVFANGLFIHFQSQEYFAPAAVGCCGDVEVVEEEAGEGMEEKYYCPFHSDSEVEARIALDNGDRRRREREQRALEEAERMKGIGMGKGKYFKGLVKGMVFAVPH